MKKVITILITFALLLALPAPAFAADVDAEPERFENVVLEKLTFIYYETDEYQIINVYGAFSNKTLDFAKKNTSDSSVQDIFANQEKLTGSLLKSWREVTQTGTQVINYFGGDDRDILMATYVNGNLIFDLFRDVR